VSFAEISGSDEVRAFEPFYTEDQQEFAQVFDAIYGRLYRWSGEPPVVMIGAEAYAAVRRGLLGPGFAEAVHTGRVHGSPCFVVGGIGAAMVLRARKGQRSVEFTAELDLEE
jgi:hypothetical protein